MGWSMAESWVGRLRRSGEGDAASGEDYFTYRNSALPYSACTNASHAAVRASLGITTSSLTATPVWSISSGFAGGSFALGFGAGFSFGFGGGGSLRYSDSYSARKARARSTSLSVGSRPS